MTNLFKNLRINMGKLLGKIPDLKSQIKFLQDTKILPANRPAQNATRCCARQQWKATLSFSAVECVKREFQ